MVILAHGSEPATFRRCRLEEEENERQSRSLDQYTDIGRFIDHVCLLTPVSHLVIRDRYCPCTCGHVDSQASRSFPDGATEDFMKLPLYHLYEDEREAINDFDACDGLLAGRFQLPFARWGGRPGDG